jgi:tRNA nucleotidyltransferase/poly(A) polymerase
MNKKIIKSIVNAKLNKWLESIKDEEVKKLAAKDAILTGGSIASLLLNEEVKDFDVYFRTKETTLLRQSV